MTSLTVYRTFQTGERREFVRITDDVQAAVDEAGVQEGTVLVSAMHITAGVWVNDDEPGIQQDALEWLDKLAPPSWKPPANDVARELSPDPGDYRHHRAGEAGGLSPYTGRRPDTPVTAHLKNLLVHPGGSAPYTDLRSDTPGYAADHERAARPRPVAGRLLPEFDGGRPKRLVIKVLGE